MPRAARPRSAPTARPPARLRAGRPARLLAVAAADDGTQFFTLAFANGAGCQWSLPNQSGWQSQVSALQAGGGDVSISFGGCTVDTDATDLGAQCSSASAMAAQVESVVSTFNVSHLDFDIESNEQADTADLALTAQALALVRSWASANGDALTISYTIPTLPTGFTGEGEGVLTTALANGFTPNIVNVMTMDYGSSGTEMGSAANQALDAAAGQLESIYGISESAAYAMLGNTPMIGQNDTPGEIFTLADAATVESYAAAHGIGWLSFWAEGRDNDGCPGATTASSTCSGISQSAGAFTQAFQAFTSGSGGGTPTPTTSGSCAAAWVSNIAYVSGNEVSYGGGDWTATQWNYDEYPAARPAPGPATGPADGAFSRGRCPVLRLPGGMSPRPPGESPEVRSEKFEFSRTDRDRLWLAR